MGDEQINLKIKTPGLQLDVKGDISNIIEIRKFFEEINKFSNNESIINMDELGYDLPVWKFSKEIQSNQKMMELSEKILKVEEGLEVKKIYLDNVNEITDSGTNSNVELKEVKNKLSNHFTKIEKNKLKHMIVHLMGDLSDDAFSMIVDQINAHVPGIKVNHFTTKKEIFGKTLIECICFGNYPMDDSE